MSDKWKPQSDNMHGLFRYGVCGLSTVGAFLLAKDRDRAIACVNALDGLDPGAVAEFIEAAKHIRDRVDSIDDIRGAFCFEPLLDAFNAALAKLEGQAARKRAKKEGA